jgi:ABC-type nitrate/sulfonate/bicarbonate transport system substrate-binding protein
MPTHSQRNLIVVSKSVYSARWFVAAIFFLISSSAGAEPLRIAYTSIGLVYGPLWVTQDAGIFKKYNIDPELLYIAGGPPSLQALIYDS